MELKFFDFEVYPHWWCCSFGKLPEDADADNFADDCKDSFIRVTSDSKFARDELMKQLREDCVLTGYNIKGYDLIVANAIYQGFAPETVYKISQLIINEKLALKSKEYADLLKYSKTRFRRTCLDLMDSTTGSLKDKEATMGLDVRETEVPFDKESLTYNEKTDILTYNVHDVWSSMYWYLKVVKPFVETKLTLCQVFNLPIEWGYSLTNAGLVAKALGAERTQFADEDRIDIVLPDKIRDYCYNNLPKDLVDRICNSKDVYKVTMFGNTVVFADGGIHSAFDTTSFVMNREDRPVLHVKSNDEWVLMNADAGSYYPSIMIQLGTLSRCIKKPELFVEIFTERLRIKHLEHPTFEEIARQLAYKLILNTTFGSSGCQWLELYDPYMRTCTCRFGQLFLSAFVCKVYNSIPDIKVIQTNTDGVLFYVRRKDVNRVKAMMDEWHNISGITLEDEYAEEIWQRDVNNYLMIKEGGKRKVKGAWLNYTSEVKGYPRLSPLNCYVAGRAVCDYLTSGKDVIDSIVENNNIFDFAMTLTKGPTYKETVYRYTNGFEYPAFKNNRVIASKDEALGTVYKLKFDQNGHRSETRCAGSPEHSLMINDDIRSKKLSDYKNEIDYMFYVAVAIDKMSGSWLEMTPDGVERTYKFDYFENQNRMA